jgi:Fe-S oxidoreductase
MRRDGAAKMRAIAEEASALVRRFKGAYSGEHGDGICRGEWIAWQFGPALNEAFRAIKQELDPLNLFNPGKIIDPPPMDEPSLFRHAPPGAPKPYRRIELKPYRRIELKPVLDWSAWNVDADPVTEAVTPPGTGGDTTGGFAKAVEMCNNNGHCRKFDAGTMCPSYRATGNERDLTRGRANTLRLALSGQLEGEDFAGPAVRESLELCVSCKGCRRECPTGVDMARMKIEVTAEHKRREGFTLRDRLVGMLPAYAPWAARLQPLTDLATKIGGAALLDSLAGFDRRRPLPRFRGPWRAAPSRPGGRPVVLFADTFNNWFEPENLEAARRVLEATGHEVRSAVAASGARLCCGRTYLTSGMVDAARAEARRTLDALAPHLDAGTPIVGLEPSCVFTFRDEYPALLPGDGRVQRLARATLIDEYLAAGIAALLGRGAR